MANHDYELKIALHELRNAIDVEKSEWINRYSTNCYAYALGLDIPQSEIVDYAYSPGVISKSDIFLPAYNFFTYKQLISNIYLDFNTLGINFREINPLDDVDIEEWKIALFISNYYGRIDDYHFLRQHKDGIWYHKAGYNGMVSIYDDFGHIIKNPKECQFRCTDYNKCFALRLKKY